MSDLAADRAANTFLALLEIADLSADAPSAPPTATQSRSNEVPAPGSVIKGHDHSTQNDFIKPQTVGLAYNIQIQLPATKDLEVYNAIFRSLKEHLLNG